MNVTIHQRVSDGNTSHSKLSLQNKKTDLYRAIVCGSSPPFIIPWIHLSCFAIELTLESFGTAVATRMNVKRLATVISKAFKLTFKLVNNKSRTNDVTN